jgi:hypothetical protein
MSAQFICHTCHCVDLVELAFPDGQLPAEHTLQQCTYCQTGQWHGHFARAVFDPERDNVVNIPNGLGLG